MTYTHATEQTNHIFLMKNISNSAYIFQQIKAIITNGDNSCCILSTMLQHRQTIDESLTATFAIGIDNPDDSAHGKKRSSVVLICFSVVNTHEFW